MRSKIFKIIGAIIGLTLVVWAIIPLFKFYFSGLSSFGDYFAGYTMAEYIWENFRLPPASWVYSLKTGSPMFTFYQWFFFYLMMPLIGALGISWGLEIFSMSMLVLFYIFSYLLFHKLSKNPFVSALLTVILYFSLGTSEGLMRAGFITQNATQTFMPLMILVIIYYFETKNSRLLVLASILSGLSLLGHIAISLFVMVAPVGLMLLFWWDDKTSLFSMHKIKDGILFGFVSVMIGLPAVFIGLFWQGASGKSTCESPTCVASIEGLRIYFNNWSLYVLGAVFVIAVLWSLVTLKNRLKRLIPFTVLVGFVLLYLLSTHYQLPITDAISTVLWPLRTVWVISLGLAAATAALVGDMASKDKLKPLYIGLVSILSAAALSLCVWMIIFKPDDLIPLFEGNRKYYEQGGPHIVRFANSKYQTGEFEDYDRSMALPEWLLHDDIDYRMEMLWHGDFGSWPMISKIPQTRSSLGNTKPRFDNWRGWLTAVMTDQLGEEEARGLGRQANINQALFLIDWYSIRYINSSIDEISVLIGSDYPYAPYIESDWLTDKREKRTLQFEGKVPASHLFDFWRIRQEYTSPIVMASNAPTVYFIGDDQGWQNFVRSLAVSNSNSREIIPVLGPATLEKVSLTELQKFDMVVLYAYNYEDFTNAWDDLERYVQEGGVVFIDTGREVKESEDDKLVPGVNEMPSLIPAKSLTRRQLGTSWEPDETNSEITKDINFEEFAPLIFGDDQWTLSSVTDDASLRSGADVVLRQAGTPIIATRKLGNGMVIWSGINLPYYILNYQGVEEAKLLRQIMEFGTGGLGGDVAGSSVTRDKPEKITVAGQDFKGVVFKENYDEGWKAKVNGKGANVYAAGPDMMYIPTGVSEGGAEVKLTYRGTLLNWSLFLVSVISFVFAVKYVLTGSLFKIGNKNLLGWWDSDEE